MWSPHLGPRLLVAASLVAAKVVKAEQGMRPSMTKRSITHEDVSGQRILCRVDFNVPIADDRIGDDTRIRAALPTIRWLIEHGGRVILCSHLGRPRGLVRDDLRLAPAADRLAELIGQPVAALREITGPAVTTAVNDLAPGSVLLLENLRFDPREEANDPGFARELADLADLYVNDAFGAAHRAHASTQGVALLLPSSIGLLMRREIAALSRLLNEPERPFGAIIGGAKISDKIGVIEHLLPRIDQLLIGGGMANTFLLAQGYQLGTSLVETDKLDLARQILSEAERQGTTVGLPVDVVVASSVDAAGGTTKSVDDIGPQDAVFDIGPDTAARYAGIVSDLRTVFWNGPLGVTERPPFANGTSAVAAAVAGASAFTVIGGGDSVAAVEKLDLTAKIDHISTGGGASLEFLEGRSLPGIEAIPDDTGASRS